MEVVFIVGFAGDALPRNGQGDVVALADKLETLVGLFGVGQRPSGDKDPFALRRHALGVVRILAEHALPLDLSWLIQSAQDVFDPALLEGAGHCDPGEPTLAQQVEDFVRDRLAAMLQESGAKVQDVDAVLSLRPQRLAQVAPRLAAVEQFRLWPQSQSLAAANKRVGNILKKADAADLVSGAIDSRLLIEPAEIDLARELAHVAPLAQQAFERGDYTESLRVLAGLRSAVDVFFEAVMVNAPQDAVRRNRLALLSALHAAMNQVAELARLSA